MVLGEEFEEALAGATVVVEARRRGGPEHGTPVRHPDGEKRDHATLGRPLGSGEQTFDRFKADDERAANFVGAMCLGCVFDGAELLSASYVPGDAGADLGEDGFIPNVEVVGHPVGPGGEDFVHGRRVFGSAGVKIDFAGNVRQAELFFDGSEDFSGKGQFAASGIDLGAAGELHVAEPFFAHGVRGLGGRDWPACFIASVMLP